MTAVSVQHEAVISDLKTEVLGSTVCKILYRTLPDREHLMAPQTDHVVPMSVSHQFKERVAVIAEERPLHAAATDEFIQGPIDRGQRYVRHGRIHALENVFSCQRNARLTKDLKDDPTIPRHPEPLQLPGDLASNRLVPVLRIHEVTSPTETV